VIPQSSGNQGAAQSLPEEGHHLAQGPEGRNRGRTVTRSLFPFSQSIIGKRERDDRKALFFSMISPLSGIRMLKVDLGKTGVLRTSMTAEGL